MKINNQLTALSKSIYKIYLAGGMFFSCTLYAACPSNEITGISLSPNGECSSGLPEYTAANNIASLFKSDNAKLEITAPNVLLKTVQGSNSQVVIWALNNGTINILGNATIDSEKTGDRSSALYALNGGKITFEKDVTIKQEGLQSSAAIEVQQELGKTVTGAYVGIKGFLTVNATSGSIILSHRGNSLVELADFDITTNGINTFGGMGLSAQSTGVITYNNGVMNVVQTGIQVSNGYIHGSGNTTITLNGIKNIGLSISNAGRLNIDGTLGININKDESIAFFNKNLNSNIIIKKDTTLIFEPNLSSGIALDNSDNAAITLLGNVTSTGDTTAINNNSNATINFFGSTSTFSGNAFNNNATISLANGVLGGSLEIGGTYTGNNGLLVLDTDLADDYSQTDFVKIGGKADGITKVDIKSGNSQGAPTINGIHIIQTQSSKDGVFVLAGTKGYITAGGKYDYYLEYRKNDKDGRNVGVYDNWYLMNYAYDDYIYTPDIGEYLATETMGNTLFTSRLEDREGASQYQGLGSKDVGNVWVRAYGGHNQFKTMNSQLKTTGNSFVTQMGTGLVTLGEEDQYNLGAMTGFAYYDGKTRSDITTRESKTKIDGYSLGFYGTWYAHPVEQRGTYIDSWVLWNKFNNSIDTPDYNKYKFNSSGVTASIEVGGDYLINKNGKKNWWVQPQSQIIYQGVHAENFQDAQGVDIYHGKDNVQMRMGVKTYLDIPTSGNKFTSYRPYVALNYIQNTNPYSVVIHDERYENEGSEKQGEIKFGIEGNTTKNSQVWLNASYVTGSHNNETYQGNIGWKYNF